MIAVQPATEPAAVQPAAIQAATVQPAAVQDEAVSSAATTVARFIKYVCAAAERDRRHFARARACEQQLRNEANAAAVTIQRWSRAQIKRIHAREQVIVRRHQRAVAAIRENMVEKEYAAVIIQHWVRSKQQYHHTLARTRAFRINKQLVDDRKAMDQERTAATQLISGFSKIVHAKEVVRMRRLQFKALLISVVTVEKLTAATAILRFIQSVHKVAELKQAAALAASRHIIGQERTYAATVIQSGVRRYHAVKFVANKRREKAVRCADLEKRAQQQEESVNAPKAHVDSEVSKKEERGGEAKPAVDHDAVNSVPVQPGPSVAAPQPVSTDTLDSPKPLPLVMPTESGTGQSPSHDAPRKRSNSLKHVNFSAAAIDAEASSSTHTLPKDATAPQFMAERISQLEEALRQTEQNLSSKIEEELSKRIAALKTATKDTSDKRESSVQVTPPEPTNSERKGVCFERDERGESPRGSKAVTALTGYKTCRFP